MYRRYGLTAFVSFVLPILFAPSTLPDEVLTTCREAIAERQNVIHGGQRRVDREKLRNFLDGIQSLCKVLQGATAS